MRIPTEVLWVVTACFGGIAKILNEYIETGLFKISRLISQVFVSGFSGWMFAQMLMPTNPNLAMVGAGLGGYLGAETIDLILELINKARKNGQ